MRSARLRYEAFRNALYAAHPELRKQHRQTPSLRWNDISELVTAPKMAFLEYVVTKTKTYLFVLTKTQSDTLDLRVYAIDISDKNLTDRAREFREMLASQDPGFADTARQLYDLLLKPADNQLKGKNTVCIIPDGILWDLPFQALQPSEGRYLLEDRAISYAPSLAVLREMSTQKKLSQPSEVSLLAFGNPSLPSEVATNMKAIYRSESLGPLPEAESEVNALKDIWGAGAEQSVPWRERRQESL